MGGARENGTQEPAQLTQLSDRELEVLRRLVAGQRPTDIAQALHLSVKTISSHKSRILARLQLPNLAALVRFGLEQGLAPDQAGTLPTEAAGGVAPTLKTAPPAAPRGRL